MNVTLEWINWEDWDDELIILNNGEKARYVEACMYTAYPPDSTKLANRTFDDSYGLVSPNRNYYFSVNVKETIGVKSRWGDRAFTKAQLYQFSGDNGIYHCPDDANTPITKADFIPIYKITIRYTQVEPDGHIKDFWPGSTPDLLQSIFYYFDPDHKPGRNDWVESRPKWTKF